MKLRVWDRQNKEYSNWTNRDPFIDVSTGKIFFWERTKNPDGTYGGDIVLKDNEGRFKVERFTGLKDIDGDDIYEGDVLGEAYGWERWEYDEEGVPLGEPLDVLGERRWVVEWFSGTMDVNCGEYATLYTGFAVRLIKCPSLDYEIEYWKGNPEFEMDRDKEYAYFKPEGLARKYDFTNFGGNGGLCVERAKVRGNINEQEN